MDKVTDVIVVGFGAAGSAAAIEAADAGAKVLILEKMRRPGGAVYMSKGLVYAADTSVQKAAQITDSADAMYDYMMASDNALRDPVLARVLADQSAEAVEWLIGLGVDFPPEELSMSGDEREYALISPPSPRAHHARALPGASSTTTGPQLFAALENGVKARKIEVLLRTSATALMTNSAGEVVGIEASSEGRDLAIGVRKAVVLADGGFAQNREMVKQYLHCAPHISSGKIGLASHPGQTGDGIKMAMALGADLCNMAHCLASAWAYVAAKYPSIWVNARGMRFVNEGRPSPVTSAHLDRQDSNAFQIFDDRVRQEAKIPEAIASRLASAPTVAGLAVKLGIDAGRLDNTLEQWNREAESGQDPEFGRSGPGVAPLITPPYWGGDLRRRIYVTYGGLRTNANSQVLRALDGKPIPRLYAAGQNTGGRFGSFYPGSGSALADSFVFGRIAGQKAAAESPLA